MGLSIGCIMKTIEQASCFSKHSPRIKALRRVISVIQLIMAVIDLAELSEKQAAAM